MRAANKPDLLPRQLPSKVTTVTCDDESGRVVSHERSDSLQFDPGVTQLVYACFSQL